MGFGDRLHQANTLVDFVEESVWKPVDKQIIFFPYGYENHVEDNIRSILLKRNVQTAKHIRFTPDFFVLDKKKSSTDPNSVYLLEYKTTQTPLWSPKRINKIRLNNNLPNIDWPDIGQMEAAAYDNYLQLHSVEIRVAILNYCAFHSRPLLCDFVESVNVLHRDNVSTWGSGSGTPFVNIDCNSMRSLDVFLSQEHNIAMSGDQYLKLCGELQILLPTIHDKDSPLHPKNQKKPK